MTRAGGGSIIGMSSGAGALPAPLAVGLRRGEGGHRHGVQAAPPRSSAATGIRVNSVQPGIVDDELMSFITAGGPLLDNYLADMPLGRVGRSTTSPRRCASWPAPSHRGSPGSTCPSTAATTCAAAPTTRCCSADGRPAADPAAAWHGSDAHYRWRVVQIVYIEGDSRRELDVRVNNPSATVDDLAAPSTPPAAGEPCSIGGRAADPDLDLVEAGLHEGAVVRSPRGAAGGGPPRPPRLGRPGADGPPAHELVVVNGLDAGRRFPLRPGHRGRSGGRRAARSCSEDGTLSRRHASVTLDADGEVTVDDLDSHNGTWVGATPVVEPVRSPRRHAGPPRGPRARGAPGRRRRPAPRRSIPVRQTSAAGTIPFNRPPRPALPPPPDEARRARAARGRARQGCRSRSSASSRRWSSPARCTW